MLCSDISWPAVICHLQCKDGFLQFLRDPMRRPAVSPCVEIVPWLAYGQSHAPRPRDPAALRPCRECASQTARDHGYVRSPDQRSDSSTELTDLARRGPGSLGEHDENVPWSREKPAAE